MGVPGPWAAVILVACVFRLWRLASEDEILLKPRRMLVNLPVDWDEGDPIPDGYRIGLAKLISCFWCLGFWLSLSIWLLWQISPHWTVFMSTPFAISTGVGAVGKLLGDD